MNFKLISVIALFIGLTANAQKGVRVGYIDMDYDQAVLFLGTFVPILKGKNGLQDPATYKMLRIDQKDRLDHFQKTRHSMDTEEKEKVFVCHACAKEFRTKKGLEKHIKDKHFDMMADKDAQDEIHDREDI